MRGVVGVRVGKRDKKVKREQDQMREKVTQKMEGPTPDRRPGCDPEVQEASVGARALPSRHLLLCEIREVTGLVWTQPAKAMRRGEQKRV